MPKLKRKQYNKLLEPLEEELVAMAGLGPRASGARICVLFEGARHGRQRRAQSAPSLAGSTRANAILSRSPSQNDREMTQWYFQRYVAHLPAAGEITLFDRSWYNRAGVEKVMGFYR